MRHDLDPPVRGYAVTHPPGRVRLPAQPGWDVVLHALRGLFEADTDEATWTVPVHRALCLGGGPEVRVRTGRRTVMRCLYLRSSLGAVPPDVGVVDLSPLATELLLRAVAAAPLYLDEPVERALVALLADELRRSSNSSLRLPRPRDDRARSLAEAVLADPGRPLPEIAARLPAGRRTLERLFRAETGLTPAAWQRRARILAAVGHLEDGVSVTETATRVGYATPSSFVAAFRAELGVTPRSFLRPPAAGASPGGADSARMAADERSER